jgi:poly(A) polymerase
VEDITDVEGASTVYSSTFYIGLQVEPKPGLSFLFSTNIHLIRLTVGQVGTRRLDISYPTGEFVKMVKMWESFQSLNMGIVVRHIKR